MRAGDAHWRVPEEVPCAFVYNGRNYAVMLATPLCLEDFAIGFSLTERVVDQLTDIHSVEIHGSPMGVEFHFKITDEKLARFDIRQRRRNIVGRAGCGVCGLENAEHFFEPLPQVAQKKHTLDLEAIWRGCEALPGYQKLHSETRSVHGVAWVDATGDIHTVREDVGRHNALDKLLGALGRENVNTANGLVLISSRCSYEIVEKAVRRGVKAVASISAPTAFAVRKAEEANLSLYVKAESAFVAVT